MKISENIEPKQVMRYFEDICAIPHGSTDTKAICDYCESFAKKHGFQYYRDLMNNIIIACPASPGYESSPAVILQGHLDMVCEKDPGYDFDFSKDGLHLLSDGDFIYAQHTTLGGDDGIAVAMALAVMSDASILHPKIEAVFTVDEEIGMTGASGIDLSMLEGRTLINIDSENEGVLTVSCAGGACAKSTIPVRYEKHSGNVYKIEVDGLRGGHSGMEINAGRANADILIGRLLYAVAKRHDIRIAELCGGLKDNAIPSSAAAVIISKDDIYDIIKKYESLFGNEYKRTDSDIRIKASLLGSYAKNALDDDSTKRVLTYLILAPNGVQRMSSDIEGLVQTSLNLGILKLDMQSLTACHSVRSSCESEKQLLNERIKALAALLGGAAEISGEYPAWEYRPDSRLRRIMTEVFIEQYGHEPKTEAIHAGLECGILCGKLENLDCVSIGPDLLDIHTPRERMSISSVQRVWKYIKEVLKRLK